MSQHLITPLKVHATRGPVFVFEGGAKIRISTNETRSLQANSLVVPGINSNFEILAQDSPVDSLPGHATNPVPAVEYNKGGNSEFKFHFPRCKSICKVGAPPTYTYCLAVEVQRKKHGKKTDTEPTILMTQISTSAVSAGQLLADSQRKLAQARKQIKKLKKDAEIATAKAKAKATRNATVAKPASSK